MTSAESSGLPPLYSKPEILSADRHAALAYRRAATHSFARKLNAVPVVLNEIPRLLAHFPIAFTTTKEPVLIALLGARDNENLFVGPDGNWLPDTYIPAYIRRYPFILMKLKDDKLVLGAEMDEEFFGAKGETLFNGRRPSRVALGAFQFCTEFQQAFEETRRFCSAVNEAGLLKAKRSAFTTPSGMKISLTGFAAVDAAGLDGLDSRTANSLRKQHWLGALYCHIASLERLQSFSQRIEERRAA